MQQLEQHPSPRLSDEIVHHGSDAAAQQLAAARERDRLWREERKAVLNRRIDRAWQAGVWLSFLTSGAAVAWTHLSAPTFSSGIFSLGTLPGIPGELLLGIEVFAVGIYCSHWWIRPLVTEWKALQPVEDAEGGADALSN